MSHEGATVTSPASMARSATDGGSRHTETRVARMPEGEQQRIEEMPPPKRDSKGRIVAIPPDPHPVPHGPPNVLTEEDYAEVVGAIIERDFFPDLPRLRAQRDLIQARLTGDIAEVREAEMRLMSLPRPTPGGTPATTPAGTICPPTPLSLSGTATPGPREQGVPRSTSQQPISAWERDDDGAESTYTMPQRDDPTYTRLKLQSGKEVIVDLTKVRLDDFQRVFTSEDNASFEEILRKEQAILSAKEWWMEDIEQKHNTEYNHQKNMLENGESLPNDKVMQTAHAARNNFTFHQKTSLPLPLGEKPKVDFTNTRFTTKQQLELENRLSQAIIARKCKLDGEKSLEEAASMAKDGNFDFSTLKKSAFWSAGPRAIAGRIEASPLVRAGAQEPGVRGFGFVQTPSLLPGEGGLSPLMTYGKIASTPVTLDEDNTSSRFTIAETSEREQVADKLWRATTQQKREQKQLGKSERLRALGIPTPTLAPSRAGTPASSSGLRKTPASTPGRSEKLVAPLSPIGQLIHAARRMAQEGGRLGISRGTPSGRTPGSSTPGGRGASASAAGSRGSGGGSTNRCTRKADEDATDIRARKRARSDGANASAEVAPLPASITDGLL